MEISIAYTSTQINLDSLFPPFLNGGFILFDRVPIRPSSNVSIIRKFTAICNDIFRNSLIIKIEEVGNGKH